MMRKIFKRIISFFLVPLTRWYLRKERQYTCRNIRVIVFQGVFHPGLFYSTKFLIDYILTQPLKNKSLLELGCGTGLLSVIAKQNGAIVTATDLSEKAIENVTLNAKRNQVEIEIIHSDLFDRVDQRPFDWIVINPPYYARKIKTEAELAWHCGEEFEYFEKLFWSLRNYMHSTTRAIMVLTLGCDLDKIVEIARKRNFRFELLQEKNVLFDGKDFLYQLRWINSTE